MWIRPRKVSVWLDDKERGRSKLETLVAVIKFQYFIWPCFLKKHYILTFRKPMIFCKVMIASGQHLLEFTINFKNFHPVNRWHKLSIDNLFVWCPGCLSMSGIVEIVEIVVHTFLAPPCGLQRWRPSNIKLVNIVKRAE